MSSFVLQKLGKHFFSENKIFDKLIIKANILILLTHIISSNNKLVTFEMYSLLKTLVTLTDYTQRN